ncbi:uncharacterized protein LOC143187767 [Calliopsis andreniformis]
MESDTQNTQNQISATFDRCLKIGEQALQQETRTPSPLEKSHQEAVQETTQEEWTITIGPPRMGPVQLRVPEHIPRTTRRYRCTVPGGRYALRWDREQRLTSLLWRPAVDPPTPRGQEKSTAPAAAASQAGGRTPNRPRPKAREDNRQQAQAPTTSRALVAARPSPIASRTRRPPRPQGPTLEELTRAAVGIAVETSMRLLQQQQQLHPQQSASPPAHKRQRR